MDQSILKIIQDLAQQKSKLQTELEVANQHSKSIATQLDKVQTALAALQSNGSKKPPKTDAKMKRVIATAADIEEAIESVLGQSKSLSKSAILNSVKSILLAKGRSRVGLKPLFTKVIDNPRFKVDQNDIVSIV